jgi:magnesium-transporting ATPase (P-type)
MSSSRNSKIKNSEITNISTQDELKIDNNENEIKFIKRTIKNNTHEVIEDSKLKSITSWRKSETKFLQNLIYNILSLGIIHIISLFYPNLYLKLYCKPHHPKECDFFLVENIYGNLTLCTKIHKKSKNNSISFNSTKENIISTSLINTNNKKEYNLTKNLTYSFKYNSMTYEYNEETNQILPVYMDLSKMTNKGIINFFSEGLSTESTLKKFKERYGKNIYYVNPKIFYLYFLHIELPNLILVLIIGIVELILEDYISIMAKYFIVFMIIVLEYCVYKIAILDLYKQEYTLDGENIMLKVKRRHKLKNNSDFYQEIKNCDLLPGDIIFLKPNDYVPCDCIILEGECIVNESNLTGNLDIYKKTCLKNNNDRFSYEINKINILYHGMKILKTFSKLNERFISALCINIGSNTYKANLFSNLYYLLEKKKEYKEMYSLFGEKRKRILYIILLIFLITSSFSYFYYKLVYMDSIPFNHENIILLIYTIIRVICKSFMPVYFLTNSLILVLGFVHLRKENVYCFEKSKLLTSSTIDTIFFSKTGTLCESNIEVNAYHPICISSHKANSVSYRTYNIYQYKEMNSQLLKFYNNYLDKSRNVNSNKDISLRQSLRFKKNKKLIDKKTYESYECTTLFLECLLSCNDLEKYNIEIFGNPIETFIFKNMKWDMKAFNLNVDINNENLKYYKQGSNSNYHGQKINILERSRNDIYPSNYYKITESFKNASIESVKPVLTRLNSKYYFEQKKNNLTESIKIQNCIKEDISQSKINSYKLRIYKRFIKDGTLNSSSITYNFITKELRFNTKGSPEELLDKCDPSSLPENFDKVISTYRKGGFIIVICASKIINIDEYKESNPVEEYLFNLTFCGFITLKSKLKKSIINSIKDLKQFDCNYIISTGDNVFNSLSVGFESKIIIDNKNIFSFDKEDNKNGIIITKIYSNKKENTTQDNEETNTNLSDRISKQTSKMSNKKTPNTPFLPFKSVNIRASTSKIGINCSEFLLNNQTEQHETTKKEGEFRKIMSRTDKRRKSMNKFLKSSKNILNSKYPLRPRLHTEISDGKIINKEYLQNSRNSNNIIGFNLIEKSQQNEDTKNTMSNNDTKANQDSNNKKLKRKKKYLEKYYYYPKIFQDNEDLDNNCIYCVSGKAFHFLYSNREKKQCKYLLEKIHKYCKIFFCMSSLDKSLVIDFYREFKGSSICNIGECQNDYDAIMTSNVGICLKPPKNINTLMAHFFSPDSDILSIKKIIREGRAIQENIVLLTISCAFYTLILNSYIICCFIRQIKVITMQLNFLEICFFVLSILAFTGKTDKTKKSNPLIKKKKLYTIHYCIQIIGLLIIKFLIIFVHGKFYIENHEIEQKTLDKIYVTYFFILCIEQLFSTIFTLNLISFYRKDSSLNYIFITINILLLLYFVTALTLNSSNYKLNIFKILIFEHLDSNIDSFSDNNKIICFSICLLDFLITIIFSRSVYYICGKLAMV